MTINVTMKLRKLTLMMMATAGIITAAAQDDDTLKLLKVDPADGSTVQKLEIIHTYWDVQGGLIGAYASNDDPITLTDAEGKEVTWNDGHNERRYQISAGYDEDSDNGVVLTFSQALETPGTYKINVPADCIFWNDEDFSQFLYAPKFTLTYTIGEPAKPFEYSDVTMTKAYPEDNAEFSNTEQLFRYSFSAPLSEFTAGLKTGETTASVADTFANADKTVWCVTLPEGFLGDENKEFDLTFAAKDAKGLVLKGTEGEEADSRFLLHYKYVVPEPEQPVIPTPETVTLTQEIAGQSVSASELIKGSVSKVTFTPAENWKVGSVVFNDEDVTAKVEDNSFTTPAIEADSKLVATFEYDGILNVTTGADDVVTVFNLRAYSQGGVITIDGLLQGMNVSLYTIEGSLIKSTVAQSSLLDFEVEEGTYVVVVADIIKSAAIKVINKQ